MTNLVFFNIMFLGDENMLEFVILSENREGDLCSGESGLSIYVKYNKNEFLFDTGYSNLFIINAEKLGIDLLSIPTVILSHGGMWLVSQIKN